MRLLLDTHTLIWTLQDAPDLSPQVRSAVRQDLHEIFVSAVSVYEIEFKQTRGRLETFPISVRQAMSALGFLELSIAWAHSERAARFPFGHRDPWDRIIAAQAILESMMVVTRDPKIAALGAQTFW